MNEMFDDLYNNLYDDLVQKRDELLEEQNINNEEEIEQLDIKLFYLDMKLGYNL